MMKMFWNDLKSDRSKKTRGVSFNEIIKAELVDILDHTNRSDQEMMLFMHKGYIWVVPFVRNEHGVFLKMLYPCRKYTKIYKKEKQK